MVEWWPEREKFRAYSPITPQAMCLPEILKSKKTKLKWDTFQKIQGDCTSQ